MREPHGTAKKKKRKGSLGLGWLVSCIGANQFAPVAGDDDALCAVVVVDCLVWSSTILTRLHHVARHSF